MSLQLVNANVVVVARHFNPSITTQLWLADNNVVPRDEFRPGCIFTDVLANVVTQRFVLFVAPEQLQFTPRGDVETHQQLAVDIVGRLVETLPHTPYTGVGLNFVWHVRPDDLELGQFSRQLFFDNRKGLFRAFDSEDARFGSYLSKNALGCRMKLDVKPMKASVNDQEIELMQFAFNFHLDLDRDRNCVTDIQQLLTRWNEARDLAAQITRSVEEE